MAYNKINWTENTPITADRLNQMEAGIVDASKDIGKCLPLTGGTMSGAIFMEYGGQVRRRIASIADHGGTDLGDSNARTTIQSNIIPTWWNGSTNRAMLVFDRANPSDYVVRCGAGLGGQAGYITFTW